MTSFTKNPFTGMLDAVGSSASGGISVGDSVAGGDPNTVLFLDSSSNLSSYAGFLFDAGTQTLTLGSLLSPETTDTYDIGSASAKWRDAYLAGTIHFNDDSSIIWPGPGGDSILSGNGIGDVTLALAPAGTFLITGDLVHILGALSVDALTCSYFGGDLIPEANNSMDLGQNVTPLKWKNLWLSGNADIAGSLTAGSLSVSALSVSSITDSGLTAGRVLFAGTAGLLDDDGALLWNNTSKFLGINITPTKKLHVLESDETKTGILLIRNGYSSADIGAFQVQSDGTVQHAMGTGVGFSSATIEGGGPNQYGVMRMGGVRVSTNDYLGAFEFQDTTAADRRIAMILGTAGAASGRGKMDFYCRNNSGFQFALKLTEDGYVGIGNVTATARLHLAGGSTTVAPLNFTSGSLLTSPVIGASEFLTDKFYGTITTSTARKEFTLNDAALTSGRVPFATTNGRLTDDADMTFATDTLTVTKIAATTFTGNVTLSTRDIITDTTTGTKIGTGTTQKLGFFNATPVVQQTDGATLTNNVTIGGTTNQLDDWISLTVYASDAAAIRNAVYQLGRKVKILTDSIRALGLNS